MFFSNWHQLLRLIVIGPCAYVTLIILLRLSGKRTLSKFNAFDFVITIALGSTFATVLLSKDVALLDGCCAFVLLIALQFIASWLSVRSRVVSSLIKSEPRLLFYDGAFLADALKRERVTEGEVLAAVREQGIASLEEVGAVIIETAGTISALQRGKDHASLLRHVDGFRPGQ